MAAVQAGCFITSVIFRESIEFFKESMSRMLSHNRDALIGTLSAITTGQYFQRISSPSPTATL